MQCVIQIKSDEQRLRLIQRDVSLELLLGTGNASLLRYVFGQIKSQQRAKDKWLSVRDNVKDGKWSNFHDACKGGFDGGSVECVKLLLNEIYDSDEQKAMLWNKQDRHLQTPLYCAVQSGKYKVVEWMLHEMSQHQKEQFFNTPS